MRPLPCCTIDHAEPSRMDRPPHDANAPMPSSLRVAGTGRCWATKRYRDGKRKLPRAEKAIPSGGGGGTGF